MEREGEGGRQRGFFASFGYTRDAEYECRAFFKRTGRIIKLLTVQEILDEEHVPGGVGAMPAAAAGTAELARAGVTSVGTTRDRPASTLRSCCRAKPGGVCGRRPSRRCRGS